MFVGIGIGIVPVLVVVVVAGVFIVVISLASSFRGMGASRYTFDYGDTGGTGGTDVRVHLGHERHYYHNGNKSPNLHTFTAAEVVTSHVPATAILNKPSTAAITAIAGDAAVI